MLYITIIKCLLLMLNIILIGGSCLWFWHRCFKITRCKLIHFFIFWIAPYLLIVFSVFWKLHGIVENILLQLKRAITLKNLLMNQLTFYSRKQLRSTTPFCTDITYLFFKAWLLNSFTRACVTSIFDWNRTLPSKRIVSHVHAQ